MRWFEFERILPPYCFLISRLFLFIVHNRLISGQLIIIKLYGAWASLLVARDLRLCYTEFIPKNGGLRCDRLHPS